MVRTLIAGNWKMNGVKSALSEIDAMTTQLADLGAGADCLICPPFTLISALVGRAGAQLKVGGQSCHSDVRGAHTGDVSAEMLADIGAAYVIVGHSERRADHGERSAYVQEQAEAAQRAGITPIVCVGETYNQRQLGETDEVITRILRKSLPPECTGETLVVAYEPIWAIGTGEVPTAAEIAGVHALIRSLLIETYGEAGARVRILYGGSMKPGNAAEILGIDHVNGGLIGGASLKADDFMAIYAAAVKLD